ncbi:MAG: ABC transporter substrate-binding protein [Acetobacteraceae bacterium]|nr:ABC transporter substrate-binding protein [Acetobacteraceae bacterium]MDW8397881.1 ABC transporter substrate-binding protein [Acetobacteraceae bacterium]
MNGRLSRRTALATGTALLVWPRLSRAAMDPARAAEFIRTTGNRLVAIINGGGSLEQRRAQVAEVLRAAVDIEGVGRFILGRWWNLASEAERREYLLLFEEIIIRNLSSRFGELAGVRFSIGRSQPRTEDDVLVSTEVVQPGSPPFALDWLVAEVAGQPKVVDVVAEGASLRLTTRSEYSSVISRNGGRVGPLLDAMRQQIARLASQER